MLLRVTDFHMVGIALGDAAIAGLNAILIFGLLSAPALGSVGAAVATGVANALAAVTFFGPLVSGRMADRFPIDRPKLDGGMLREIARVGALRGAGETRWRSMP